MHFSAIAVEGYRALEPGEEVSFTYESVPQDGYSYRAVEVRKKDSSVAARPGPSDYDSVSAYSSEVKITFPPKG